MKSITTIFKKGLLFAGILTLTYCQQDGIDMQINERQELITKDSKVVQLMIETANLNSSLQKSSSQTTPCTAFKYPITFNAFFGDSTVPAVIVVYNDAELIEFFNTTLTVDNKYHLIFPVTLTDTNGDLTVIPTLDDLEGTLQMALDICNDDDDDSNDDDDNDVKYDYCDSKKKKVYICHKGKTICVSINAIWGHLNQHKEDYLGKCN